MEDHIPYYRVSRRTSSNFPFYIIQTYSLNFSLPAIKSLPTLFHAYTQPVSETLCHLCLRLTFQSQPYLLRSSERDLSMLCTVSIDLIPNHPPGRPHPL